MWYIFLSRSLIVLLLYYWIQSGLEFKEAVSTRRVREEYRKSILVAGYDLTSEWIKLIKKGRISPLEYDKGKIKWRREDEEGNPILVSQRREGNFILELNTFRAQRPSSNSENESCLFCELGATHPWNEILSYQGWKILANPYPIIKEGHFTIIPESSEHLPQRLGKLDIKFALQFIRESKNLFLLFNSWSAGATQAHLHFQALFKKFTLPVEDVEKELLNNNGTFRIYQLKNYPAQTFFFEGVEEKNLTEQADLIFEYLSRLENKGWGYNLIFVQDGIYLFPRQAESPLRFPQLKPGALEMAGWFTFSQPEIYSTITERELNEILKDITAEDAF